jgi:sRNA-binding protein
VARPRGVHKEILELAGDDIDEAELGRFFRWWTQRFDYLDAIAHAEPRLHLDGSPAGVPTPDQQCSAAITVYGQARGAVMLAKIRSRATMNGADEKETCDP